MSTRETLRINLPKAIDYGNLTIGSRAFHLTLFAYGSNAYKTVTLDAIDYTPAFVPFQVWTMRNGMESGQYAGSNGTLPLGMAFNTSEPIELVLYNLSVDAQLSLTFSFTGYRPNEFPG